MEGRPSLPSIVLGAPSPRATDHRSSAQMDLARASSLTRRTRSRAVAMSKAVMSIFDPLCELDIMNYDAMNGHGAPFTDFAKREIGQLSEAVRIGNFEDVHKLLITGADVNENIDGKSVLHQALSSGNYYMAALLLERGARVNRTDCVER